MKLKVSIFPILIFLTACATTLAGTMQGKVYYSPNNEFKVSKPGSIYSFNFATDTVLPTEQIVEFSTDNTYWMNGGLYSVNWILNVSEKATKDNFIATSNKNIKKIVANKYAGRGIFKLIGTEETSLNNNQSLYFEATGSLDGIKAEWIGNIIRFNNRIAVVSLIIPSDTNTPKPYAEFYSEFAQSLEQIN
jgi:hypothetical protein